MDIGVVEYWDNDPSARYKRQRKWSDVVMEDEIIDYLKRK